MRGRPGQITQEQLESLELALALMKANKTGATRTKFRHLEIILEHRNAEFKLMQQPEDPSICGAYSKSLSLIGNQVAKLINWIPPSVNVKTLDNYRSIDWLRYVPVHIKRRRALLSNEQKKKLNMALRANVPEDEKTANIRKKLRGRKPTTLRGILARQRLEQD